MRTKPMAQVMMMIHTMYVYPVSQMYAIPFT